MLAVDDRYYPRDEKKEQLERQFFEDKRKQPGISFPSTVKQQHVLIIRLDLNPDVSRERVQSGLLSLGTIFENIYSGQRKTLEIGKDGEEVNLALSNYNFTSTIGFGFPFFEKLGISKWNRPNKLYSMPHHSELGDSYAYTLNQTDILIQLASSSDYINRWVYEYSYDTIGDNSGARSNTGYHDTDLMKADIVTAIQGWSSVQDLHIGFQRVDGRNLLGFKDGLSNPDRFELDNIVWTQDTDESEMLSGGTYMVFQKIEHDLDTWRAVSEEDQEELIGRSKGTGLLLGTLSKEKDRELAQELRSEDNIISGNARRRLNELLEPQRDPNNSFSGQKLLNSDRIQAICPVWSHVRKANPRQADGSPTRVIYRRGYLFSEVDSKSRLNSGLLFICFQKNIKEGFEFIKKNWLNNKNFPVPDTRKFFTEDELSHRHFRARFSEEEIVGLTLEQRRALGFEGDNLERAQRKLEAMTRKTLVEKVCQVHRDRAFSLAIHFLPPAR